MDVTRADKWSQGNRIKKKKQCERIKSPQEEQACSMFVQVTFPHEPAVRYGVEVKT